MRNEEGRREKEPVFLLVLNTKPSIFKHQTKEKRRGGKERLPQKGGAGVPKRGGGKVSRPSPFKKVTAKHRPTLKQRKVPGKGRRRATDESSFCRSTTPATEGRGAANPVRRRSGGGEAARPGSVKGGVSSHQCHRRGSRLSAELSSSLRERGERSPPNLG